MIPGKEESKESDGETQDKHVIEADESEEENQETFDYGVGNIVYDDGQRLVISFEEEADSNNSEEEPSIVEYCNTDEDGCSSHDSK